MDIVYGLSSYLTLGGDREHRKKSLQRVLSRGVTDGGGVTTPAETGIFQYLPIIFLERLFFCIWVIPCEIIQKSAILTPTPFDFGENW